VGVATMNAIRLIAAVEIVKGTTEAGLLHDNIKYSTRILHTE